MAERAGLLDNCERELLHLSGEIQPHGALLIIEPRGRVSHVSTNVHDYLPGTTPELLLAMEDGLRLVPELDRLGVHFGDRHRIFGEGWTAPPSSWPRSVENENRGGGPPLLDWHLVRTQEGGVIVEVTPHEREAPMPGPVDGEWGNAMHCLRALATLLGHERYMFYGFLPEGDGEVVEELCTTAEMGTYKDLRFPAGDIPQVARALYEKNPFRLIPDSRTAPVHLQSRTHQVPDLTYSDLRSVSPVHRAYMANMGIVSSISIPVLFQGKLRGLISAHSRYPVRLSGSVLADAVRVVQRFGLALSIRKAHESLQVVDRATWWCDSVLADIRHHSLGQIFPSLVPALEEEFDVDGAVLFCGDSIQRSASVSSQVASVLGPIAKNQTRIHTAVEELSALGITSSLDGFVGALFLTLLKNGQSAHLALLRREHLYMVAWGGKPNKPQELTDPNMPVSPRNSFERWVEQRRGHCLPWERSTILMAHRLRQALQELEW